MRCLNTKNNNSELKKSDWTTVQFKVIADIKGGDGFPEIHQGKTDGLPFIKVSDMELEGNRKYIFSSNNCISEKLANKLGITIFKPGTIVFAKVGAALLLNRRRILKLPTALDNNMMGVTLRNNIDPEFIYQWMLMVDFGKFVNPGAVPSVNQKQIGDLTLVLPSHKIQKQIADILSTVDNTIKKTEALIEKYQKVKEGMMQDLFTRGIGEDGKLRPTYHEAPELYKETELGMLPKEWSVKTFKTLLKEDIVASIQDGNHGESHPRANDFVNSGVPFLIANNLKANTIDITSGPYITHGKYRSLRVGYCKEGDVLLTHKGTIGLTAVVKDLPNEIILSPQVTAYRINNKQALNNIFLHNYFQTVSFQERINSMSKQSTRDYIGITSQQKLYCIFPSMDEQIFINKIVMGLSIIITNEKIMLAKRNKLKQALMQDLLTGKVRVPA